MKDLLGLVCANFLVFVLFSQGSTQADYPITPVAFSQVRITDDFWSPKLQTNHKVTIPIAVQKSVESGRIDNFKKAAGLMPGPFGSIYPFDDSDVFKIVEAASYSLQVYPDAAMDAMLDSLIYFIAAAQEPDGYLYTNRSIKEGKVHPWAGDTRWEHVNELSHELYNLGHMYEAAVAHHTATGKRTLLNVALKSADLLCETFGPGKIQNYPGHQEVEIGLVKLYRITGKSCYLELAKFFLDARGKPGIGRPDPYNQSHIPVTEQREAVGHSVRAAYMWSAMADVAAITENKEYIEAINYLWEDIVGKKYYINGGIGSTGSHEGFGPAYDLPNMTAYNETCAGVGNAMWNHRMFLMTGDSKYMDVLERTMYNNILTGVSYEGDHFFYPNPLSSNGQHQRSEWFGCACCPPNVARFLPSMPGYIYARRDNDIFVNLYISNEAEIPVSKGAIGLRQTSHLPWNGEIELSITNEVPVEAAIHLRIPGWASNRPVPGDLYSYIGENKEQFSVSLNGIQSDHKIDEMGYVTINRLWSKGDRIHISLPFEIKKVRARDEVEEDRGKIAIERGPLLYCAEWADNGDVSNLLFNENTSLEEEFDKEDFGGIIRLHTQARKTRRTLDGSLEISEELPLTLIPYFLWNNRGPGQMLVWLATTQESTHPAPAPTIVAKSRISSSEGSRSLMSIADQEMPRNSRDQSASFFHWWPKKDSWEWVQFDFDKSSEISEVQIYWFSDVPGGGTDLPKAWTLEYQTAGNDTWIAVNTISEPGIIKDGWSEVKFDKLTASALRINVKLSKQYAAGIHEVVIR